MLFRCSLTSYPALCLLTEIGGGGVWGGVGVLGEGRRFCDSFRNYSTVKNVRTCIFKKSQHISPQFDQLPFSVQVFSLFVEHFFSVGSFF